MFEDLREFNLHDPHVAACRLMQNLGQKIERDTLGLSGYNIGQLRKLFMATEADVRGQDDREVLR